MKSKLRIASDDPRLHRLDLSEAELARLKAVLARLKAVLREQSGPDGTPGELMPDAGGEHIDEATEAYLLFLERQKILD